MTAAPSSFRRPAEELPRILLVEDDRDQQLMMVDALAQLGLVPVVVGSAEAALASFDEEGADIIITDLLLPGMNGGELLLEAKRRNPGVTVLVMSVVNSVEQAVDMLRSGADDYLVKPVDAESLRPRLDRAIARVAIQRDVRELEALLERSASAVSHIVGSSPAVQEMLARVPGIARSRASVLVQGENGTGKELLASAIHMASQRFDGPLITVSCASIPDGLWEREFFGHRKGAFSGASESADGLVAAAEGGTLFLDEVGEIPVAMQAKLLRFLQQREYRPVGATRPLQADVRIISATNKDLLREVEGGKFRSDLYYRLGVLPIEVPPLRVRKADVPLLAEFFLNKHAADFERQVSGFSLRALHKLSSYDFPGNVRELENIVQQCLSRARYEVIGADDIPVGDETIREARLESFAGTASPTTPRSSDVTPDLGVPYKEAKEAIVRRFERDYVVELLRTHDGNVSRAARGAGLSRKSLARIMERHDICSSSGPGRPSES